MSNLVLLISDEHNPRYASPYGHPFIHTPNMQRLAEEGTIFETAYCPSPLCLPSRSSFMSGRWVHEIQTYSNCNVGMEGFRYPSYGAILASQGIHTVHVGKTDVYRPGEALGFSEMLMPQDRPLPGDTNHGRRPLTIRRGAAERADRYGPRSGNPFGVDLEIMECALAWLRERAPHLDRPWVLAININKPHFPHWVTPELWDMYPQGADLPPYGPECASANHPYARDLRAHFETDLFTEEQVRGLRRGYLGCVTFVDQQLGRILAVLEETGQLDRTNVIYGSDHGEMLGKFGMWWKCSLYEDSVRVPLIAMGPDFASGMRVKTPVTSLDLQATVFQCVGGERPTEWRGKALQHIAPDDPQRVVFAEYHGHGTRSGAFMIRKGDWKLVYYMEGPHQLFNLARDPEELENLADVRPDKVAELEGELRRICDPEEENTRAHRFEQQQLAQIEADPVWREVRVK